MIKLHLRRRTILAAAPALVAAPYVVRAQGSKPEKSKVVLAVGGKSALYYLSLTIAEKKGFFKDAGLEVEIPDFQGGSKSLEALWSVSSHEIEALSRAPATPMTCPSSGNRARIGHRFASVCGIRLPPSEEQRSRWALRRSCG